MQNPVSITASGTTRVVSSGENTSPGVILVITASSDWSGTFKPQLENSIGNLTFTDLAYTNRLTAVPVSAGTTQSASYTMEIYGQPYRGIFITTASVTAGSLLVQATPLITPSVGPAGASTLAADVSHGTFGANLGDTGAYAFAGALTVTGATTLSSATTVTTGGLRVSAGNVGVGTAISAAQGLTLSVAALTGTSPIGVLVAGGATSAATSVSGFYSQITTAALAYTLTARYGFYHQNVAKGAGSTITNDYGMYIESPTQGGTLNYALWTNGTAPSQFGGALGVTGAATLSSALAVTGATTLSSAVTASTTLAVTGAFTASSAATITGLTTLSSALAVTGAMTASSALTVTGVTTLSSAVVASTTLAVTGAVTASSAMTVTGITTLSSAVVASTTLAVTGVISGSNSILCTASNTVGIGFGVGYKTAVGAGSSATQGTSKVTAFTLNTATGQITWNNSALAAYTTSSCTWTCSAITSASTVNFNHISGGTLGTYNFTLAPSNGSAILYVRNLSSGSLSEAPVLLYTVVQGAVN